MTSDLALAAFAASTGAHVVSAPRSVRFGAFLDSFDPAGFVTQLSRRGVRFIGRSDAAFPPLLRAIHDPPPGLFLRGSGSPDVLTCAAVAIVGARACSGYGSAVARMLGRELAAAGAVVVEAREASGALITADFALEEGREVFAVPGEITSALSAGTNALLRLGATPLTSAADVLESLGIAPPETPAPELGEDATAVLELLRDAPASADALTRASGLDAAAVGAALVELELSGLVAESAGIFRGVRPAG